ncbi:MAG: F0F1 ATP synthase subunit A [Acidobacteriota bacterium]|nr:MAG: F0F1 ATP synthase subunit A [Acidobacteriota bacterium]
MSEELSLPTQLIEKATGHPVPDTLVMASLVVLGSAVALPLMRRRFSVSEPGAGQQVLEGIVVFMRDLLRQVAGPHGRRYIGLPGTFFVFILLCNLCGMVPGLGTPTGTSPGVTFGLSFFAFFYYQTQGFLAAGPRAYVQHYFGPVPLRGFPLPMSIPLNLFLGLLFPFIEILSHLSRALTLSVRLFGNIHAEHVASLKFLTLAPFGAPLLMSALGAFGSVLQAFIFFFLTSIYIGLFVSHEH